MIALLRTYLAPYKATLALVVGLLVVQALATLYLPELNGDIINNGVVKGDTDLHPADRRAHARRSRRSSSSPRSSPSTSGSKTGMAFGRDVRGAIFRKVESFSQAELNTFGTPSLITRNTNDVQQVQMVVLMGLNMMIIAPILAVGGLIMALRQDVPLSGILLVILPIMALIVGTADVPGRCRCSRRCRTRSTGSTRSPARRSAASASSAPSSGPAHEEERFDVANLDLTETSLRVNRLFAIMIPLLMAIFNLSSVAILWFGAIRVEQRRDADRQPHRVPAVRHADPVRGDDGRVHVHHGPAGRRLVRPDPGGPPDRRRRSAIPRRPSPAARHAARSTSATSSSATRAPRSRSCGTSRSWSNRARRRPSSAARAAARPRSSTSSRASTT